MENHRPRTRAARRLLESIGKEKYEEGLKQAMARVILDNEARALLAGESWEQEPAQ